jgi:hypothetical protein
MIDFLGLILSHFEERGDTISWRSNGIRCVLYPDQPFHHSLLNGGKHEQFKADQAGGVTSWPRGGDSDGQGTRRIAGISVAVR